ncbi:tetraacyldisaccharide 4'-kinase [Pseudochelatococcus sp. G4_1912]|uniref:tetraacyldisaccharide 4'-kinase n=1 Tax=Pseudochelatococcus sp. G4_1912 TaxID=3114288 RepID=UPI0039C75EA9
MHSPDFWWSTEPSLAARLLQPLGKVYGNITVRRMAKIGATSAEPVICIGNFIAGGAGKTPTAIAVAEHLRTLGRSPAFLTRGYGGRMAGPVLLAQDEQTEVDYTHLDVGDEPLLLSRHAPVMVARNRLDGLHELLSDDGPNPDVIIMDDGLQNPSIRKTLTFAVVDGKNGNGNGLCIPAGPLRAPFASQLPYVDALIIIGGGVPGEQVAQTAKALGKRIFTARIEPDTHAARAIRGRRVLAFAGIGKPEKFFTMLERIGAEVVSRKAFPDHAPFSSGQIAALEHEAQQHDLLPVTTEKDAVRLLTISAAPQLRASLAIVPVQLVFDDEDGIRDYLKKAIEGHSAG